MTRKVHDQFSKRLLDELLSSSGTVQTSYTLSSEIKEIDLLFHPHPTAIPTLQGLGLLGRMAAQFCLIEPYRNPIAPAEIEACLGRAIEVSLLQRRIAKRDSIPAKQVVLPQLWILSPTASAATLQGFGAQPQEHWGPGIYFLADSLRTAIVVLHQLPPTLDTMWLRLLARGSVQTQAVEELLALSTSDAFRKVTLHHLAQLQLIMKTRTKKLSKDEQELVENLNPIYEVWERETINRGIEQGIERGIEQGIERGIEQGIERGIEQGIERGIEQGIERGRQEERQQMLSRTVPLLLQAGLSIDQIATQLQVSLETVRQAAGLAQD
jgi:hypothetical protein